jgi:hypothetical protein
VEGVVAVVVDIGKMSKSKLYECPICRLKYKEKKWAKKCEEWCKKFHSCNLEITRACYKECKTKMKAK